MKQSMLRLFFVLFGLVISLQPALAETRHPYRALTRGVRDGATVKLAHAETAALPYGSERSGNIRFTAAVPGLGRVRLHFQRLSSPDSQPLFSDGSVSRPDTKLVTLLKGKALTAHDTASATGSIYEVEDSPHLFVSFRSRRKLTRRVQHFRLDIPLSGARVHPPANVHRVSAHALDRLRCEPALLEASPGPADIEAGKSTKASQTSAASSLKTVELALYADAAWHSLHGNNSNAVISTIWNDVESIYENQLGLTFTVVRQEVLTSRILGSTDAGAKLEAFTNAVVNKSLAGFGTADVYHHFTGQDLAGATIGMAWQFNDNDRGVVCRGRYQIGDSSFSLTQWYRNTAYGGISFAHEVGHNFGAIHPEEDRATFPSPPPVSIMTGVAPSNPNDPAVRLFSDYSVNQITSYVSRFGSCLSSSSPAPTPTPNPTPGAFPGPSNSPTPAPTSGGGGRNTPTTPDSIPLTFSANVARDGLTRAAVDQGGERPGCSILLRASTAKNKVSYGTIIAAVSAESPQMTFEGTVTRKARAKNKSGKRVRLFLAAQVICPDGSHGTSPSQMITAHRIASRRSAIGPKQWFSLLRNALAKQ
jgi:hypothetical protein